MITEEEIKDVAKLARLELTQEEIKKMGKELSSILDFFKSLDELDVSQVTPAFYLIPLKNVMREDKAEKKDKKEIDRILSQVPSKEGKYIKVKEILKQ